MKFCTHMAYIFVGSYTKFEVDGSVRYRDIAINVKWGQKIPPAARALIVFEIYVAIYKYHALWAMNERAQERCHRVTCTCHVG